MVHTAETLRRRENKGRGFVRPGNDGVLDPVGALREQRERAIDRRRRRKDTAETRRRRENRAGRANPHLILSASRCLGSKLVSIVAAVIACTLAPACLWASFADDVHALVAHGELTTADRLVRAAQSQAGPNSEVAAAMSWLARGALAAKQLDRADAYASETRKLSQSLLGMRRIDADPWLPTAVGASIEVHADVLAARGEIPEALMYLREQLQAWRGTSLEERISKNINLLSLEGKPAPPLEGFSLSALRGRPALLFFWAHWCPDCKADVPILAAAAQKFAPKGLTLIGPTRLYGYVAGGDPAPPAVEKQYIEQVRQRYYAPLGNFPHPVSAANFQAYGASTTPTIVLVDRAGIVRYYHPGAVTAPELDAHIQAILR